MKGQRMGNKIRDRDREKRKGERQRIRRQTRRKIRRNRGLSHRKGKERVLGNEAKKKDIGRKRGRENKRKKTSFTELFLANKAQIGRFRLYG